MRKGIKPFSEKITENNIELLEGLSYVFICIDNNSARSMIISKLKNFGVTFIDAGLGVNVVDGNLIGQLRVTVGTPISMIIYLIELVLHQWKMMSMQPIFRLQT